MDFSLVKEMLQKDAVTAAYGLVSANLRKGAAKLLGKKNVGSMGMNALSVVAGTGLSQINNPHIKIIGAALRIGGIASIGNELFDKLINRNKEEV